MSDIKLSEIIPPVYRECHKAIKNHDYVHYWINGGRGSIKSTFVSEEIILGIKRNPGTNALVLRQVAGTLKDSVYNQCKWAIDKLGLSEEFKCTLNPLEIVYIPTGQRIYFRGLDNPLKLKSIKPNTGYIAWTWFEELAEMDGMETIRNVLQSTMRGGEKYWVFYSYNPPKSKNAWVNEEALNSRDDMFKLHTTYLDIPKDWLGEQFIVEAEHLKENKPLAYQHEYLGYPVGTGGNVFDNVTIREITDEEISTFGNFYYGIDWGWSIDPTSWGKMAYDSTRRKLYILDEIYIQRLPNRELSDMIKAKGIKQEVHECDSADPRSIAELREYGIYTKPAEKGAGSVEYGMKWLQDLEEIVIDPKRTPNAAKEFVGYEYDMTKDGKYISRYPDRDNHYIDTVRYSLKSCMRKKNFSFE